MSAHDEDGDTVTPTLAADPGPSSSPPDPSLLQLPMSFGRRNLGQPSLFDNNFEVGEDFGAQVQRTQSPSRPPSPWLLISSPDGQEKEVEEENPEDKRAPYSESDLSSIKSLEIINDHGFGGLEEPEEGHTPPEQSPHEDNSVAVPNPGGDISRVPTTESPIAFAGSSFGEPGYPTSSKDEFARDAEDTSIQEAIDEEIRESLESSKFGGKTKFWPLGQHWRILNASRVRELLKSNASIMGCVQARAAEDESNVLDGYVDEICGRHPQPRSTGLRKILAILIMMDKVACIIDFIEAGIQDLHLPLKGVYDRKFKLYSLGKKAEGTAKRKRDEGGGEEGNRQGTKHELTDPRVICQGWGRTNGDHFELCQSYMLAAFFRQSRSRLLLYHIADEAVLPFLEYERKSEGGYGTVYKVKIHPKHHALELPRVQADAERRTSGNSRHGDFTTRNLRLGVERNSPPHDQPHPDCYAVKKLHFGDEKEFARELTVLEKFSGDKAGSEHLIRLLLAYKYKEDYFLMFHLADCNLKELWRRCPKVDATDSDNCHWFINQCVGITTGLRKIHRVSDSFPGDLRSEDLAVPSPFNQGAAKNWGRHGDIKPENILWFGRLNRMVISDFGLSRFHTKHSVSKDPYDSLLGLSPTYRAPECDLRLNINQKYDIWALGCVFLEFLSWFVLDETIEDFVDARIKDESGLVEEDKFFIVANKEARVKRSVLEWMDKIRSSRTCTDFILDFVDIIEQGLLVPDVNKRDYCEDVVNKLIRLQKRCREDERYYKFSAERQEESSLSSRQELETHLYSQNIGAGQLEMPPAGLLGGKVSDTTQKIPLPEAIQQSEHTGHDNDAVSQQFAQATTSEHVFPQTQMSHTLGPARPATPDIIDRLVEMDGGEVPGGSWRTNSRRKADAGTSPPQPPRPVHGESTINSSENTRFDFNCSQDSTPPSTGPENSLMLPKPPLALNLNEAPPESSALGLDPSAPSFPLTPAPPGAHRVWADQQKDDDDDDEVFHCPDTTQHQHNSEFPPGEKSAAASVEPASLLTDTRQRDLPRGASSSQGDNEISPRGPLPQHPDGKQQYLRPTSAVSGSGSLAVSGASDATTKVPDVKPSPAASGVPGQTPGVGAALTTENRPRKRHVLIKKLKRYLCC